MSEFARDPARQVPHGRSTRLAKMLSGPIEPCGLYEGWHSAFSLSAPEEVCPPLPSKRWLSSEHFAVLTGEALERVVLAARVQELERQQEALLSSVGMLMRLFQEEAGSQIPQGLSQEQLTDAMFSCYCAAEDTFGRGMVHRPQVAHTQEGDELASPYRIIVEIAACEPDVPDLLDKEERFFRTLAESLAPDLAGQVEVALEYRAE